jgi:flagellar biosynthesis/type III secretory pathway chaperone
MLGEDEAPRLREVLRAEINTLSDLLDALARERAALTARDTAALEAAVQDKHDLIGRLRDLERERAPWMPLAHFPGPMEPRWPTDVQAHWNELIELSLRCRRDNEMNGTLLEACRRRVSEALHLLTGRSFDDSVTYGLRRPDGPPTGMRFQARA